MKKFLISLLVLFSSVAYSQTDSTQTGNELFDLSLEDLLNLELVDRKLYLYGYINSNLQKTFNYPTLGESGEVKKVSDPAEWTPVRNFHIYGKGNFSTKISYLFNLAYVDEFLEVRNAWGNFAFKDFLQVRVGKMYRKFGLYNERLDQIPTFIGIEPPEMLDQDHLFLTRTTNFMLHGELQNSRRVVSYALMTDNGEGGAKPGIFPLGWDLRYKSLTHSFILGTSGYSSSINNKKTTSTVSLGDGSPRGGILPWMAGDHFVVAGVYFEKQFGNLLVQSEYYRAAHSGVRDPASVLSVIREAGINPTQRDRFIRTNEELPDNLLTEDDIETTANFDVQTWYIRLGYNIQSDIGQFVPYLFLDWMSYPEVIQNKDFGGDDESGLADDGVFWKPSAGLVYRPIPNVAIKLDGSVHMQEFYGKRTSYPEIRLDFSFAFSNQQLDKALD
ncbi:hypothetical protein [Pseudochryseolinea flava]|uniref:Porin n=1 Tax=Pseudochryseolinea flava TaxID=2059302 RepID=A0A364XY93_9BACT|nr:hypothetical protein [Pseudochryseolinea flava]RAV98959.1 hypothetical protein DQQ10_21935 [Pseudochryseolinea flava]